MGGFFLLLELLAFPAFAATVEECHALLAALHGRPAQRRYDERAVSRLERAVREGLGPEARVLDGMHARRTWVFEDAVLHAYLAAPDADGQAAVLAPLVGVTEPRARAVLLYYDLTGFFADRADLRDAVVDGIATEPTLAVVDGWSDFLYRRSAARHALAPLLGPVAGTPARAVDAAWLRDILAGYRLVEALDLRRGTKLEPEAWLREHAPRLLSLYGSLVEKWQLAGMGTATTLVPGPAIRVGRVKHADGWLYSLAGENLVLEGFLESKASGAAAVDGAQQRRGFLERLYRDRDAIRLFQVPVPSARIRLRTRDGGTVALDELGADYGEDFDGWYAARFDESFHRVVVPRDMARAAREALGPAAVTVVGGPHDRTALIEGLGAFLRKHLRQKVDDDTIRAVLFPANGNPGLPGADGPGGGARVAAVVPASPVPTGPAAFPADLVQRFLAPGGPIDVLRLLAPDFTVGGLGKWLARVVEEIAVPDERRVELRALVGTLRRTDAAQIATRAPDRGGRDTCARRVLWILWNLAQAVTAGDPATPALDLGSVDGFHTALRAIDRRFGRFEDFIGPNGGVHAIRAMVPDYSSAGLNRFLERVLARWVRDGLPGEIASDLAAKIAVVKKSDVTHVTLATGWGQRPAGDRLFAVIEAFATVAGMESPWNVVRTRDGTAAWLRRLDPDIEKADPYEARVTRFLASGRLAFRGAIRNYTGDGFGPWLLTVADALDRGKTDTTALRGRIALVKPRDGVAATAPSQTNHRAAGRRVLLAFESLAEAMGSSPDVVLDEASFAELLACGNALVTAVPSR